MKVGDLVKIIQGESRRIIGLRDEDRIGLIIEKRVSPIYSYTSYAVVFGRNNVCRLNEDMLEVINESR